MGGMLGVSVLLCSALCGSRERGWRARKCIYIGTELFFTVSLSHRWHTAHEAYNKIRVSAYEVQASFRGVLGSAGLRRKLLRLHCLHIGHVWNHCRDYTAGESLQCIPASSIDIRTLTQLASTSSLVVHVQQPVKPNSRGSLWTPMEHTPT